MTVADLGTATNEQIPRGQKEVLPAFSGPSRLLKN
jgi:hypothetical protein